MMEFMERKTMQPDDLITAHFRLVDAQKKALARLSLITLCDLLYHLPTRHIDAGKSSPIELAEDGERVTLYGQIEKTGTKKSFRGHVPMGEATMRDKTGKMKLVWFHQAYMAKMVQPGDFVRASGTVKKRGTTIMLVNPELEKIPELPRDTGTSLFEEGGIDPENRFLPVYPESKGITSRWFYHAIRKVSASGIFDLLKDPIPATILKNYHLPSLATALVWLHAPREEKHALSARKRFAFEEIFFIQLERQQSRMRYEQNPTFLITPDKKNIDEFIKQLGFPLTTAQQRAVDTIFTDFASSRAMLRLLEGDVGSGKTAVAAATIYATVTTRPNGQSYGALQTAYMCPTEILATQHFESFIKYFVGTGMSIGLITGSGCRKFPSKVNPSGWTDISRTQFLKWVASGEIPIVIGTHALIQKSVKWKHLAYVIIDEQHRFGTKQRAKLVQKEDGDKVRAPHFLSMTATPIPRTLALTLYGDLDLSILDQMPSGRKPVVTEIVPVGKREAVYEKIRTEIKAGRQAYVICPRIDEPDPDKEQAIIAKSVKEEATRLQEKIFPEFQIDILHSKMKPSEKDDVMELFAAGDTDILVATSVVEVGVNVPNATLIIIEGAERFGLAQLHQLRGRVLRSTHQAYCYLFSETKTEKTFERLKALTTAKNGFELSGMDLALRGSGELGGGKQWGISDIGMEAIKNLKMVEAAREEAKRILSGDLALAKYPTLKKQLEERTKSHFE
ncbi:MAG: ATP-dependent DNA helicase RecG [Parcubacteria group bacterium GW2011_GWA2_47_7]|nr:MAG: ATP-dependent DNA helicase RecG [Parcubacteria group bacterium GW2011_GWA2_47_7]